jgi:hypothetical protein
MKALEGRFSAFVAQCGMTTQVEGILNSSVGYLRQESATA